MSPEEYLKANDANVCFAWAPKPDITTYELALLVRYAIGVDRLTLEAAEEFSPVEAVRHFKMLYRIDDYAARTRATRLHARIMDQIERR